MKTITVLFLALAMTAATATAAEDAAFSVKVTGHGRSMILIPGLACPGEVWDAAVARFGDRFECHVLTISGFGGRPARAGEAPLLETVRAELAHYVRDRKLHRPVLVGHSLGGFLALDLAARHPELPGELVILDSLPFILGIMRPDATAADAKPMAEATVAAYSRMDAAAYAQMVRSGPNGSTMAAAEADLERIIGWGLASDATTVARAMTELYSADLRPALGAIQSRTLALAAWVGYAPYSSHEFVERIYRNQYANLPRFHLEITDTARHFIMLDEPEWTFAQIEAFLVRTES